MFTISVKDGKTLTLDEPLKFEHLGVDETFGERTVEFRGLLNIALEIRGGSERY